MPVPLTHPCTYPLHSKTPREPMWIEGDIERVAWCRACQKKQQSRSNVARNVGYKNRQRIYVNDMNPMMPKRRGVFKPSLWADKYRPDGLHWCSWGQHFGVKRKDKGNSVCLDCLQHYWHKSHSRHNKRQLGERKVELQAAVTGLIADRNRLAKEIRELQKSLKHMRVVAEDMERRGVGERLNILPVETREPPPFAREVR